MARRRRSRTRKSDEAPGWIWMLFGLGIGLIIALGVYLNTGQVPISAAHRPAAAQPPAAETVRPKTELPSAIPPEASSDSAAEAAAEPLSAAASASPEDPERFGFYELLPNFEVIIPEVETPAPRTQEAVAIEAPGVYVVQAGSFLTESDAEAQRARLALLGIESRIQHVSIDDRRFHRVRVGPTDDLDELNSIRTRLLNGGIESMIMRMTE
jgi:cell division protein FtsN